MRSNPTTIGSPGIFVAASDGSFDATVGAVRLTGAAGTFAPGTAVTIIRAVSDLDPAMSDFVSVAGDGVEVAFPDGVAPAAPLTVTFYVGPSPGPEWVPVSMHQTDIGSWEPVEATSDGLGHIAIVTADFSIHLPSWLNPRNWFNSLVGTATSFLGGRTEPGQCPPADQRPAPAWASFSGPPTGATHVCMFENSDAAGERVEVELRSNRGTYLIVSNPVGADYVHQDVRSSLATVAARWLKWVAADEWVIAPGDRMTYGYRRTASGGSLLVDVHANNAMILVSGLSALLGDVVALVKLVTCFVGDFGSLTLTVTSFTDIVKCAISGGGELADGDKALAAVRDLYGSTIDKVTLDEQAKLLVSQADKLKGWGRILTLVSLAQAVIPIWTQMLDALNEALAPGAGDINVVLEPGGTPATTGPVVEGERAKAAQLYLNALGYGELTEDGRFGAASSDALRRFLTDRGIADGGALDDAAFAALEAAAADVTYWRHGGPCAEADYVRPGTVRAFCATNGDFAGLVWSQWTVHGASADGQITYAPCIGCDFVTEPAHIELTQAERARCGDATPQLVYQHVRLEYGSSVSEFDVQLFC